ncbi:MAG: hypothetical protein ABSE79_17965 [Terriglobia bacterium]|jgi:hypothetical protein
MRGPKAACALVGAALATLSCTKLQAAEVTVRLINGNTGAPIRNVVVGLLESGSSPSAGTNAVPMQDNRPKLVPFPRSWTGRTDADGKATFSIPDPPRYLVGCFGFNLCQRHVVYYSEETANILGAGVLSPNERCDRKGKLKGRFAPKPGEWVIFGTPFPWWQTHLPDIFAP